MVQSKSTETFLEIYPDVQISGTTEDPKLREDQAAYASQSNRTIFPSEFSIKKRILTAHNQNLLFGCPEQCTPYQVEASTELDKIRE
jgi:hypothetical protein